MPAKAVKKQLKKKLENKHRKKVLRKKPQQPLQQTTQQAAQQPAQNTLKQNTLRAQLLARATMMPGLGFFPQQYGNNTNNKSINNLQSNAEMLIKKINDESMRIQALENSNKARKGKLDDLSKERKQLEAEDNKLQKDYEIAKDNLDEKKRIDAKREEIRNRMEIIDRQSAEYEGDADILKAKKKLNEQQDANHDLNLSIIQSKAKIEANKIYAEAERYKKEAQVLKAEKEALLATLGSDEFQHPEKYYSEQYEAYTKQKQRNELLKKQLELVAENNRMRAVQAAQINMEDADKEDKRLEGDIQKQAIANAELRRKIEEESIPIETLKDAKEELGRLRKEGNHLQNELEETKAYADDVSTHLGPKTQNKIDNRARSIGAKKAEIEREQEKLEHKKQIKKAKYERAVIEGEEKELDKPFTKDEQETIDKEGAEEASLEQAKEQKEAKTNARKAKRDAKVAQAAVEYTKSPEFTATETKILQDTIDTQQQLKEKHQYDILDKSNQQLIRAATERHVAETYALSPGDASSVVQLNAFNEQMAKLDKARKKQINQINNDIAEKKRIMDTTYSIEQNKVKQNPNDTIQHFISEYPQYQTVPSDYTNMDPKLLRTFSQAYQDWHYNPKRAYGMDWGDNSDSE